MNRFLPATLLTSAVAISLGACGDDTGNAGFAYGGGGGSASGCSVYTTCGSCTPIVGCGWCFSGASGACASDPDGGTSASEFTWTWDPPGCPDVEAGVVPLDAGAPLPDATPLTFDAGPTPFDAPPSDATGPVEAAASD